MGSLDLIGKEDDDFTVIIDGIEIPVFNGRIRRAMDEVAASLTAEVFYNETDPELQAIFKPFQYLPAEAYLGKQKKFTGVIYSTGATISENGKKLNLEGWSVGADAIDSQIQPPYENLMVNLKRVAPWVLEQFDDIVVNFGVTEGSYLVEVFERVSVEPEETAFSFLTKLARQRGILQTTNDDGEWVYKITDFGSPIANLQEELPPLLSLDAFFDGRKRFSEYRALGRSPKRKKARRSAISVDENISRFRLKTVKSDESTDGNIQDAADWERGKAVADSISLKVECSGWYTPRRTALWEENKLVTLTSDTVFVPDGFDFLIKTVEYLFQADGNRTRMELVPPQSYTKEPVEEPWFQ